MLGSMVQITASDIATVDTVAQHPLGTLAYGDAYIDTTTAATPTYATAPGTNITRYSGNIYMYLQGVASTVYGDIVTHLNGLTARATSSSVTYLPVGLATAATVANTFGWYLVSGIGIMSVVGTTTTSGRMISSGTAGQGATGTSANQAITSSQLVGSGVTSATKAVVQVRFPVINAA